jgi:hypothetical protein
VVVGGQVGRLGQYMKPWYDQSNTKTEDVPWLAANRLNRSNALKNKEVQRAGASFQRAQWKRREKKAPMK